MAHWAKIDENNIVENVVVGDNGHDDEGEYFVNSVFGGTWVKTSINTIGGVHYTQEIGDDGERIPSEDQSKALRFNYAGIGHTYHPEADAFSSPAPYESWVLNTDTYIWEAPVAMPEDGAYYWDEESVSWVAIELEFTEE